MADTQCFLKVIVFFFLSVSVCLCVSLSLCLCLSVCLFFTLCLFLYFCFSTRILIGVLCVVSQELQRLDKAGEYHGHRLWLPGKDDVERMKNS